MGSLISDRFFLIPVLCNSVLQCFIYNPHLKQLAIDTPFVQELNKIKNVVDLTSNGEYTAIIYNLKDFIKCLPFKRFEQQDAHEFILYFLDSINNESLYHGTTRTDICCLNCQTIKNVYEKFNSINLSIPLEKSNLTELLVKYFEKELYDQPDNLYMCDNCSNMTETIYKMYMILEKLQDKIDNLDLFYDIKRKQKKVDLIKLYNLKPQSEYEQ